MIRPIFRKDWNLLWPLVTLQIAIQIGLTWAIYRAGFFSEDLAASALLRPLTLAWFAAITALVAAVVHQDPLPGVDQDWLIRPLKRRVLLAAKLLFILATVSLPMLALDLLHAHLLGFSSPASLQHVLFKELYVLVCLIVPLLALAAATRNMTEFITLGAALTIVYAGCMLIGGFLSGPDHCPTCGTGVEWLQHLLQHIGVLAGALVVIVLQYRWRMTRLSLVILAVGAAAFALLQLPWDTAFSLQSALRKGAAPIPVAIAFDAQAHRSDAESVKSNSVNVTQATRALMRGDLQGATQYLHRRGRSNEIPIAVDLPLRIDHVPDGGLLLFDRSQLHLFDRGDRTLEVLASPPSAPDSDAVGQASDAYLAHQTVYLPTALARSLNGQERLRIDYSITLAARSATYRMAALNGRARIPEAGLCATRLNQAEATILLRCKQLGLVPFCYRATLYAPDGRHAPAKSGCSPDYRPYLPPFATVASLYGLRIPIPDEYLVAHHTVNTSELVRSYLLIEFYAARGHFTRSVDINGFALP